MFEVGFTEIILILGLALLVLGPEKLPGLAEKVGRWTGRARSMARQLRTQLEHEVTMEEMSRSRPIAASQRRLRRRPILLQHAPEPRHRADRSRARSGHDGLRHRAGAVAAAPSSATTRPPMPLSQPTLRRRKPRHERRRRREPLAEGTLISHLIELRERLLRAVIAVFVLLHSVRDLLRPAVHARRACR